MPPTTAFAEAPPEPSRSRGLHPRPRGRTVAAVLLSATLLLAGVACGDEDEGGAPTGVGASDATSTAGAGTGGSEAPDAATTAQQAEPPPCAREGCEALASGNWTSLPGYLGPLDEAAPEAARVDEASVRATTTGAWSAAGLVVNGPTARSGALTITATLVGADGTTLDRVTGTSPVAPLHAGEPAPFRLGSPVDAAAVHEVVWEASAPEGAAPSDEELAARRGLRFSIFWTHPATSADAPAVVGHDLGGRPAHVVYGELAVTGDAVERPMVAAVWLDDAGRLLAFVEAPAHLPGSSSAAERLEPGSSADLVLIVTDPDVGPSLHDREPILWGYPR